MGLCFAIPLVVSVLLCAGCAKENQFPVQKPKLSLQFIHNMLFLLIRFFLVSFLVLYGDNLSILITYIFFSVVKSATAVMLCTIMTSRGKNIYI